jgi:hypothetical protein
MQRAKRRSPLRQYSWRRRFESSPLRCNSLDTKRERGVEDMKLRFDEVLYDLEQERLRVDEDLRRLAGVAAYLRTLLLPPRRRRRPQPRRRCTPGRSLTS